MKTFIILYLSIASSFFIGTCLIVAMDIQKIKELTPANFTQQDREYIQLRLEDMQKAYNQRSSAEKNYPKKLEDDQILDCYAKIATVDSILNNRSAVSVAQNLYGLVKLTPEYKQLVCADRDSVLDRESLVQRFTTKKYVSDDIKKIGADLESHNDDCQNSKVEFLQFNAQMIVRTLVRRDCQK